jgi:polar amino acid transport system substrate-binding protein
MRPTESRSYVGWLTLLVLGILLTVVVAVPLTASAEVTVPAKGASPTLDRIRSQNELRAAIAIALPWVGQDPKTGKYFGPAIEQGERIAKILGVELKLFPTTWDAVIAQLQSNRVDLILATLTATEQRRKVIDFVIWTKTGFCYAVLKENTKINTLEDLNQPTVTIGVFTGTGQEHLVRGKYKRAKIDSIPMGASNANRFEDVLARRIDATGLTFSLAHVVVHEYPQMKIIPGGPDYCAKDPDVPQPMGMGIPYGDPVFKQFLEAVVADMKGETEALLRKYSQLEYMRGTK